MKAVNFWKTLFCAALAITAFSACSDDDNDDDGGIPSITVDGKESATLAVKLEGGTTEAVEVVSTGNWVLELSGTETGWCHPSKETGGKGKTSLTFTVDKWEGAASTDERSVTASLTTNGSFEGIPIPKKATIVVKQNGDGSTAVTTNVAEVRKLLEAIGQAGPVTDEVAKMTLTGIVVSDAAGSNMASGASAPYFIAVQDNSTEAGSGLTLNSSNFKDLNLAPGDMVSMPLTGAEISYYSGALQFKISNDVAITTSKTDVISPVTITPDKLLDYESMLVKIENCMPATGVAGSAWNNTTNKGNANFVTTDGQAFIVRTGSAAAFKDAIIPEKSGSIIGISSRYNADGQIMPRTASDLAGLDQPMPEPEYTEVTINNLGVGNYMVKGATIVGVHQKGVMFGQQVDGTVYYVLGFNNAWDTQTANPYIADVDKLAEVKGTSALRYGIYQFSDFDVTVGSASTLQLPAPADFDAAAIDAYVSDPVYKYVKVVGVLDIDTSNPSYKTYTISIAGVTGKTVAFAYGLDSYYNDLVSGDVVEATGFALGYDTSGSKLNIMLRDIKKNTTEPAVVITTEPATFAATSPEAQTLAYTVANTTADQVSFTIEGTDAAKFSLGTKTDNSIVVNAVSDNVSDAAYTANLVAKIAGETMASVELKQAKKTSTGGDAVELTLADIKAANITGSAYLDKTFDAADGSVWSGFVLGNADRLQLGWNTDASKAAAKSYLLSPVLPKAAVTVTITPEAGTSAGRVFVLLPKDFVYEGQSVDDIKALAYAVSSATVKGSTTPISFEAGNAGTQFQIRVVGGAGYLTDVKIEY